MAVGETVPGGDLSVCGSHERLHASHSCSGGREHRRGRGVPPPPAPVEEGTWVCRGCSVRRSDGWSRSSRSGAGERTLRFSAPRTSSRTSEAHGGADEQLPIRFRFTSPPLQGRFPGHHSALILRGTRPGLRLFQIRCSRSLSRNARERAALDSRYAPYARAHVTLQGTGQKQLSHRRTELDE